jgi:O-succinylbenzoate synthase
VALLALLSNLSEKINHNMHSISASYHQYILDFKNPSGTSRGVLTQKETWFIVLKSGNKKGIGECGLLRGLSIDDRPDYEAKLKWTCNHIHLGFEHLWQELLEFPSIQMGLETAFLSLQSENPFQLFPSNFTQNQTPILINGLIWMGAESFMLSQIETKLKEGFSCIKLKIGAIDFNTELKLLSRIRQEFDAKTIEIRVDANGAFSPQDALFKLNDLAQYDLHSIEQPIAKGQTAEMAVLCQKTPLAIALDEELIGVFYENEKRALLEKIRPQYIILKPSFVGGLKGSLSWISMAESLGIQWWITSALESNIGLNAIAQWTFTLQNKMPQGLGTGALYTNNLESPLTVSKGFLHYDVEKEWTKPDFFS